MADVRPDGSDASVSRPANPLAPRMRVPRTRTLSRVRLNVVVDEIWAHKLTLVVAAAGCGKTTALAQFVARSTDPVAWYRADVSDASTARFLECVATALAPHLPGFPTRWDDPIEMALATEDFAPPRAAFLVDDLHTLRGAPAERAFADFLVHLPAAFSVAVATRSHPDIDVSRLLLDGDVLHITSDDLRFRTWETEALFRELYGLRIPPEELARLTRRVRGWPAGLRLYQLAARGKTPIEQRRLVDVLSTRSWPMRDYLTRNILDTLRPELREFLISTSVLGVVTAQLSDELLERSDSDALLRELESLDLLTTPLDDTGCAYHYHEVLRAHLEARLLDRDDRAGRRHLVRAGELLESHGWIAEALRCFGRAEAWESVARIVGAGAPSVGASWAWLDTLPAALIASDPRLLLSRARAKVSAGKLADAIDSYRELEPIVDAPDLVDACRRERSLLATWLEPRAVHGDDWHGRLRMATQRDPARAFDGSAPDEPGMVFGAGVASLLSGDLAQATRQLEAAASDAGAGPALLAGAQLAYAIAVVLRDGGSEAHQIDLAEEAAERVEVAWLARLARAAFALTDRAGVRDGDEPVCAMCDGDGDEWGAALAQFFSAWRAVANGDALFEHVVVDAAERFDRLNAPVLVTWAQSLHAIGLARAGRADALRTATAVERRARTLAVAGPRALAVCALDLVDGSTRGAALLRACAIDESTLGGLAAPAPTHPERLSAAHRVQLFGSFRLVVGDEAIDLKALRPRVRSLVRLLALHAERLVHREAVLEALWPNTGFDSGRSNLHTAVSAARQALEPHSFTIERESDSYRLACPPDTTWDTSEFQAALQSAQRARSGGDRDGAYAELVRALSIYVDDLLTEEGPSDWVVAHRDRLRLDAVNAAIVAAELALASERHDDAVSACERAVALDPCADRAWHLMATAFERNGSLASAERARQAYLEVQQKLGIVPRNDAMTTAAPT
jgi:DNA-binding SARP family transcriptional activator